MMLQHQISIVSRNFFNFNYNIYVYTYVWILDVSQNFLIVVILCDMSFYSWKSVIINTQYKYTQYKVISKVLWYINIY